MPNSVVQKALDTSRRCMLAKSGPGHLSPLHFSALHSPPLSYVVAPPVSDFKEDFADGKASFTEDVVGVKHGGAIDVQTLLYDENNCAWASAVVCFFTASSLAWQGEETVRVVLWAILPIGSASAACQSTLTGSAKESGFPNSTAGECSRKPGSWEAGLICFTFWRGGSTYLGIVIHIASHYFLAH
jgi:hypothetical protein